MKKLSLPQQEIYFDHIINPENPRYNIGAYLSFRGSIDNTALIQVLENALRIFDAFRITKLSKHKPEFLPLGDLPETAIVHLDFSKEEDSEKAATDWMQKKMDTPINIHEDILFGFALLKINDNESWMFTRFHHLITDGYGIVMFLNFVCESYAAKIKGTPIKSDFPSYLEAIEESQSYLDGIRYHRDRDYWSEKFTSQVHIPEYPDKNLENIQLCNFSDLIFSKQKQEKIKSYCTKNGISLQHMIMAVLAIYHHRISNRNTFECILPIYNRNSKKLKNTFGLFSKMIPFVLDVQNQTIIEFIKQIRLEQRKNYRHVQYPISHIKRTLNTQHDYHNFNIFFNYKYFDFKQDIDDLEVKLIEMESSYAQSAIEYVCCEFGNDQDFFLRIKYATSIYDPEIIKLLRSRIAHIIDQLLTLDSKKTLSDIKILPETEILKLLEGFNDTTTAYSQNETIPSLFLKQVKEQPEKIALVYGDRTLTYKELENHSNWLANYLQSNYMIENGDFIGLKLERNEWLLVAILAVLKLGAAYVPIDTKYPAERISYIEKDTNCKLILTEKWLEDHKGLSEESSPHSLKKEIVPEDLAYLMYTSGSTGIPKGVMISHKNIISLVQSCDYIPLNSETVWLSTGSISFDAATIELWGTLLNGGKLILSDSNNLLNTNSFKKTIQDNFVNTLWMTASWFHQVIEEDSSVFETINYFLVGGDRVSYKCTNSLLSKYPDITLVNGYGPTENTTFSTTYTVNRDESKDLPIGRPLNNKKAYILNKSLTQLQPIGSIGELCVGGAGLALGYLNQDTLSEEKFINNPIIEGERIYRTGDLARWLPDGNIEFIGREDDQVKIRGYRVELGEIEHALLQVEGIKQACVLTKERSTDTGTIKLLIAYYVEDKEEPTLDKKHIREELSSRLPDYMLPTVLIKMDSFPLTINGKLNRKALLDPKLAIEEDYVAPVTEIEEQLCKIWQEVLGIEKIGINDDFFRMGGNSLLSSHLKSKLNELQHFKHLTIADVFKYRTIQRLIESTQKGNGPTYKLQHQQVNTTEQEIAIIGISGAFSGANTVEHFWKLIKDHKEGIQFYSKDECRHLQIDEKVLENPNFVPVKGAIADIDLFDALFWEISPNEAKLSDPQIRKFLEHCWYALESSGYSSYRKDYNIGIFAGSDPNTYFHDHVLNSELADQIGTWEVSTYNDKGALATKTAFLLGLTGPAYSISTACSTGLVSIVEACQNLRYGSCNMALAGGVSLSLPGEVGYIHKEGMIMSKDGHCRTFDQEASGTTGGSGIGVVLLKRLEDAVKDNDNILGVIKGYATNNDGDRKSGYTAPSVTGQSECIINAQQMAGIKSDQIDYIECHGTATKIGDPIEVQALKEAFDYNGVKEKDLKHKTVLGSVKANIGHTNSAAGVAGLIKVCSMLENNLIPGQINFNEPNPELYIDQTDFEIIKENRSWQPRQDKQRLAGVSSYGIGGTNAHLVVGDYISNVDSVSVNPEQKKVKYVIPIAAKSNTSLQRYKQSLIDYLNQSLNKNTSLNLRDIAYTLEDRRAHFNYRCAFQAQNVRELLNHLRSDTFYAQNEMEENNKVVFMFPGQGVQYPNMGRQLYENEKIFRDEVDRCVELANQYLNVDLYEVLYPEKEGSKYDINETRWAQICLFVIEYAMSKYLEYIGVEAAAYIGHSFGEYVAATLAGVFTLEDAVKVVISRGKIMQSMQPGSMLTINAKYESVKSIVEQHHCEIAVINSIEDIVASGNEKDILVLQQELHRNTIPSIVLNTSHAYHSSLMDEAVEEYKIALKDIPLRTPTKAFISNLTGDFVGEEVTTAAYWCLQLRNTVLFAKGIETIALQYHHKVNFIEVGAGKGLSYFIKKYKDANQYKSLKTLQLFPSQKESKEINGRRNYGIEREEDIKTKLWTLGIINKVNRNTIFKQARVISSLPNYQFDYQRHFLDKNKQQETRKFNALSDILYERSWERKKLVVSNAIENVKDRNVLVLIHDKNLEESGTAGLLDFLSSHFENLDYVIHQQHNSLKLQHTFDLTNELHIATIFNRKSKLSPIDTVLYISPSIDLNNPSLDILTIRNIFDWSKKSTKSIPKLISVSLNNYEVLGNEEIVNKPSIAYGVTKSIPFEYISSGTEILHLDLSTQDKGNNRNVLQILEQHKELGLAEKDVVVLRGKYLWFPIYKPLKLENNRIVRNNYFKHRSSIFLITGGLGGLGYAYADYITKNYKKSTLIIIGRTKEEHLKDDSKAKLMGLRDTEHHIIYSSIDIGHTNASSQLAEILKFNNINSIDVVFHTAVSVAKSSLHEKKQSDIKEVISPKIPGVENLIKLANFTPIHYLISCSSLASILPSLGQMEYTAANLYLDEISYRNHANIEHVLAMNINQISDIGIAVEFIKRSTSNAGKILNSIKSYELPGIMENLILSKTIGNIAISRYDLNVEYTNNRKLLGNHQKELEKENTIEIVEDSYSETEHEIAQIFGNILGVERVSLHDDFFKIGGNSILAVKASHQISLVIDREIRVDDVFRHSTISKLAIAFNNTKTVYHEGEL